MLAIPKEKTRPLLEAVNLTKRYEDGVLALDHVSFAIQPGHILVMLGGNGAGKTTIINLFLNFIEPTDGEARIGGIVTHKEPLLAKQQVSFVSENVMLYPNFTAIQNLDFFCQAWWQDRLFSRLLSRCSLASGTL